MKNEKDNKTRIISSLNENSGKTKIVSGIESGETRTISNGESGKTRIVSNGNSEKTSELFDLGDNEKKIDSGFYKDPISFEKTIYETDFDLDKLFPGRTKSGHVKINRNFLTDAEPFSLERLNQETKNISEGIFTGFNTIDLIGAVTSYKPLAFYGLPRKEIALIMLNLLVNMTLNYKNKHFLYFTYSEYRIDMEFKIINVLSERTFENKHHMNNNLEQWIKEIGSTELEPLIEKVKNQENYSGLRNFLTLSDRIHIIDANYGFEDLIDSIRSFSKVFDIGAVIIDNGEEIGKISKIYNDESPKIKFVTDAIRKISLELDFPFFYGYTSIDAIKKDISANLNFINFSTRVIKVRKEYPKVFLVDNDSGKELVLNIDYDLYKVVGI